MHIRLIDILGITILVVSAAILLAIGGAASFFLGFAWSLIIAVAAGALIYHFVTIGPYGEGAYLILPSWFLLGFGIAVGIVLRMVLG